jgi:hypothetical protein
VGEVDADDAGFAASAEGDGEVASAAAEIKDDGVFSLEDGAEALGGACAPETVNLERENVVERVIARRDLREHLANFARGFGFGVSAFGLRAFHRRFAGHDGVSHGVFRWG